MHEEALSLLLIAGVPEKVAHRFAKKVVSDPSGCWIWTAAKTERGYGCFAVKGKQHVASRWIYKALFVVDDHLDIDHLCRVTSCVNPSHLEAVTHRENTRRGNAGKAYSQATRCKNGHEWNDENTRWYTSSINGNPFKQCLACTRERQRKYRKQRLGQLSHS